GKLDPKLVPQLCDAIALEQVALDWGEGSFDPGTAGDLLAALTPRKKVRLLRLCDDQARWGRFEQLEDFLVGHGISFDRSSDGKFEYDPELVVFRPGNDPRSIGTNAAHEPVVTEPAVSEALAQLTSALELFTKGHVDQGLAIAHRVHRRLSEALPARYPALRSFEITQR